MKHNEDNNEKKNLDGLNNFLKAIINLITLIKDLFILLVPGIIIIMVLFGFDNFKEIALNQNILSEKMINFISDNSNGIISIILVVGLVILALAIRKTGKKELETNQSTYNILYRLHYEFLHKLRDGICNLYARSKRVDELKKTNNIDAIKEVQARAYDNLKSDLQNFVDLISDFLSRYNNDTISVCIKTINPGQETVNNLKKKAKTLVRSKNTKRERTRNDETITLGKNTDFKHLCDGTNIWYHGVNLKKQFAEGTYENEAPPKDWQKKYNSTIVVPIRYFDGEERYNEILGFLCIDSKEIKKNWDEESSMELQYLAIFADSIYTYIKLFRRLFEG